MENEEKKSMENGNNNDTGMMGIMMIIMVIIFVVSVGYMAKGLNMHSQLYDDEAEFHKLQDDYFSVSKDERDTAPTDSELSEDFVVIQNFPSQLLTLKLVGMGKILTGIYLLLLDILLALIMVPLRIGKVMKKGMMAMMQK